MDEAMDTFKKQITFHFLVYLLNKNLVLVNETSKSYVRDGAEFFEDIAKGLETILSPENGYHISEDLGEVIKKIDFGYKDISKCSREEITEMTKRVRRIVEDLYSLEKNPKRFYARRIRKEKLSTIFRRIEEFYDWKEAMSYLPILGGKEAGVLQD
jgi:hypothetical protein